MQEFSSVTASSYDAESLAPLLTEKAAEGWDVISIVAAGTNIVAYLSRDGDAEASDSNAGGAVAAATVAAAGTAAVLHGDDEAPADDAEPAADEAPAVDDEPAAAPTLPGDDAAYVPADTAITADAPDEASDATWDDDEIAAAAAAAAAADEPAGWAAAPDNDVADLADQVGSDDSDASAGIAAGAAAVGVAGAAAATGAVGDAGDAVGGLADTAADTDTAAADQAADAAADQAADTAAEPAAAESSVPAGWYADPSGRYELRYWDGTAWTEHVSRAGQQFTDPPVA